jgi:ribose transport system ATP-binding protein
MMAICDDIITIFDGKITGRIGRKELMKEEELQHAIQRK